jgi:hypothetical protein
VVGDGDADVAVIDRQLRLVLQVVANEDHTGLAGFLYRYFLLAVGPDVPVEDVNVHVRVDFFQFQGIVDGVGAADPAAVGAVRLTRSDALDENR